MSTPLLNKYYAAQAAASLIKKNKQTTASLVVPPPQRSSGAPPPQRSSGAPPPPSAARSGVPPPQRSSGAPPPPPPPPPPSAARSGVPQTSSAARSVVPQTSSAASLVVPPPPPTSSAASLVVPPPPQRSSGVPQTSSAARSVVPQTSSAAHLRVQPPPQTSSPASRIAENQIILANRQIAGLESNILKAVSAAKNAASGSVAKANADENISDYRQSIESLKVFIRDQKYIVGMTRLIMEKGLNWIDINPNGNCYFLAVSFALTNTFPDIINMQNNFIALFLRKKAVEGVIANAETLNANFGWPQYNDIYGENYSTRIVRFEALPFESKKKLYKKIMSKYYVWAGDYESSALLPYLTHYCYKIYNYGNHVKNQPDSFGIDIQHNCGNLGNPVLKIFHTGNHYDALLTREELENFNNLFTRTEAQFKDKEDLTPDFIQLLEQIQRADSLADIVRLEESINLIKIEILRRKGDLDYLNTLYNTAIEVLTELLKAEGAIEWEASPDFANWEAAEVSEKFSSDAEQPDSAKIAAQLRQILNPAATPAASLAASLAAASLAAATPAASLAAASLAAASLEAASFAAAKKEARAEFKALYEAARTPAQVATNAETNRRVTALLTVDIPSLDPNEFLEKFPTPSNVNEQAYELYKGYTPDFNLISTMVMRKLNESESYNIIIPRIGRNHPQKTMGALIQSNYMFAADPDTIIQEKIKLIIQTTIDSNAKRAINNAWEAWAKMQKNPKETKPLIVELDMIDDELQDIETPLTRVETYNGTRYKLLDLIEAVRQDAGSVLVNCSLGMSRSTAIILMYLMRRDEEKNMSLLNAWRFLKYKRPVILPNTSFVRKLQTYELKTRRENTVSEKLFNLYPTYRNALTGSSLPVSVATPKGQCGICDHQNPLNVKQCEKCKANIKQGGKRKSRRNKVKSRRTKSHKRKYHRV